MGAKKEEETHVILYELPKKSQRIDHFRSEPMKFGYGVELLTGYQHDMGPNELLEKALVVGQRRGSRGYALSITFQDGNGRKKHSEEFSKAEFLGVAYRTLYRKARAIAEDMRYENECNNLEDFTSRNSPGTEAYVSGGDQHRLSYFKGGEPEWKYRPTVSCFAPLEHDETEWSYVGKKE